ncbi:MAG: hypothetical protein ACI9XU_002290, partial [Arenicella sp.]
LQYLTNFRSFSHFFTFFLGLINVNDQKSGLMHPA